MPIDLYEGFTNKIAGETFRCISFSEAAFSFEWTVQPGGYIPFEHIHLRQDEIFCVREGEIRLVIDGKEYIAGEGQSIRVPKGSRHIAYNNQPRMLRCDVSYEPGLDNYKFFQCFGGLTVDNYTSKNGTIHIGRMLYFTKKMKAKCITRPTKICKPLFHLATYFFFLAGTVMGWKKLFIKYTGEKYFI